MMFNKLGTVFERQLSEVSFDTDVEETGFDGFALCGGTSLASRMSFTVDA